MENSYLNRTLQYLNVIRQVWVRFCQVVSDHFLDEDISKGLEVLGEATCGPICFLFLKKRQQMYMKKSALTLKASNFHLAASPELIA